MSKPELSLLAQFMAEEKITPAELAEFTRSLSRPNDAERESRIGHSFRGFSSPEQMIEKLKPWIEQKRRIDKIRNAKR